MVTTSQSRRCLGGPRLDRIGSLPAVCSTRNTAGRMSRQLYGPEKSNESYYSSELVTTAATIHRSFGMGPLLSPDLYDSRGGPGLLLPCLINESSGC
ncbi:unnamed protein product [Calypogeia fissa]